ncbi:hypothetical protein [Glutamicibacter sp. NPDC087344]|uniref:hypothetical protein n=1 Tax=Glutamicibacter sp. NPDC087344 TaxID=3363994 RepID=UPI00381FAE55
MKRQVAAVSETAFAEMELVVGMTESLPAVGGYMSRRQVPKPDRKWPMPGIWITRIGSPGIQRDN